MYIQQNHNYCGIRNYYSISPYFTRWPSLWSTGNTPSEIFLLFLLIFLLFEFLPYLFFWLSSWPHTHLSTPVITPIYVVILWHCAINVTTSLCYLPLSLPQISWVWCHLLFWVDVQEHSLAYLEITAGIVIRYDYIHISLVKIINTELIMHINNPYLYLLEFSYKIAHTSFMV